MLRLPPRLQPREISGAEDASVPNEARVTGATLAPPPFDEQPHELKLSQDGFHTEAKVTGT